MQGLEEKAEEQALKYLDLKLKADSIRDISEKTPISSPLR